MPSDDVVSREEFELVVRTLVLRIQSLTELVSVTTAKLSAKGVISAAEFQEILERCQRTKTAEKLTQALAALQGFEAIRNVLKDFEGPLQ
jgi:hypothetical protein